MSKRPTRTELLAMSQEELFERLLIDLPFGSLYRAAIHEKRSIENKTNRQSDGITEWLDRIDKSGWEFDDMRGGEAGCRRFMNDLRNGSVSQSQLETFLANFAEGYYRFIKPKMDFMPEALARRGLAAIDIDDPNDAQLRTYRRKPNSMVRARPLKKGN